MKWLWIGLGAVVVGVGGYLAYRRFAAPDASAGGGGGGAPPPPDPCQAWLECADKIKREGGAWAGRVAGVCGRPATSCLNSPEKGLEFAARTGAILGADALKNLGIGGYAGYAYGYGALPMARPWGGR